MPFVSLVVVAFGALLALARFARLRYRTLAALLLACAAVLAAAYGWLGSAHERVTAPVIRDKAITALLAQPWPGSTGDLARLVSSFHALNDAPDEVAARFTYTRNVERRIVDQPPLAFARVADGLSWVRSLPAHNDKSPEWREIDTIRQQAVNKLLAVRFADTSGGWPESLGTVFDLKPGSKLVDPGVWAVDPGPGSRMTHLQYALEVRNLGEGRIAQAHVTYREVWAEGDDATPPPRGAPRLRLYCGVHVQDLAPGSVAYNKCSVETLGLATPQAVRQLEHLAQLRSGALVLEPMTGGALQYDPATAPDAEPLPAARAGEFAAARKSDADYLHAQTVLRESLREWLIALAVLGAGFAIPGIRRQPIGLTGLAILAAVGAVASLAATSFFFKLQGMETGWIPVIASFVSLFYESVFLGGILLGNLALWQHRRREPLTLPPG
ncbi:MAG: hypothetical protein JSS29_16025 [Proteobacteria bacterium]|nr:hypothetical protein [Pseudomonadota bacterium]